MENALLVGLSRQMALRREMDVVANNIANQNTTGFKSDSIVFQEFLTSEARDNEFAGADRRISFVVDRATWNDLSQGTIQQTGNPLDVAIDGKGFLVVETPRGERYTRNGALLINARGELVTSEGFRVLGDAGPIVFQPNDGNITIGRDGSIAIPNGTRGKLRLVNFANPQQLRKDGASTFASPGGAPAEAPDRNTRIVQGAIEKSNVRPIVEMTRMVEVSRSYTTIAGLLQQQGDLRRNSLDKLAEVPA